MSDVYSDENLVKNPCAKFIRFKGSTGKFSYWDKEKGDKGEEVVLELPIKFIALRQMVTISGFDEANNCGIFSNEVSKTSEEQMVVRSFKGGEIARGLYREIKDEVKSAGGKYTQSVYAMTPEGELVNFQFSGSAFSGWLDRDDKSVVYEVKELKEEKKGAVKYFVPVFDPVVVDDKNPGVEKARSLYHNILKPYLEQYMKIKQEQINNPEDEVYKPSSHLSDEAQEALGKKNLEKNKEVEAEARKEVEKVKGKPSKKTKQEFQEKLDEEAEVTADDLPF